MYWFDGGYYTYAEASADWEAFGFAAFHAAVKESNTDAGLARLDRLSAPEWLDETPIGSASRFGRLMLANTVSENGGDPGEQSALDLIGLTGGNPRSSLDPLPGYDEKWHIVGGNDQLVHGMAAQLPDDTLHMGHRLVALRERSDGSHTLTFDVDGRAVDVAADYVVLALPFTTLRDVDLTQSGFTAAKLRVIDTFGMGSNAKIHIEVAEKTWARHGFNGVAYTDWHSFDVCWDNSVPLGARRRTGAAPGIPRCEHRTRRPHRRGAWPVAGAGCQLVPRSDRSHLPGYASGVHGRRIRRPLGAGPLGEGRVLLLQGRPVRDVRTDRRG